MNDLRKSKAGRNIFGRLWATLIDGTSNERLEGGLRVTEGLHFARTKSGTHNAVLDVDINVLAWEISENIALLSVWGDIDYTPDTNVTGTFATQSVNIESLSPLLERFVGQVNVSVPMMADASVNSTPSGMQVLSLNSKTLTFSSASFPPGLAMGNATQAKGSFQNLFILADGKATVFQ
ncbi:MAG: hypothetical protein FWF42_00170 [Streptococcaceae bacterium]|nr:hypothetical protein [Streptococcaceae bacterium]MCL2680893.1 hypothetical protein [Streptococcaceae bacterium]MCL2858089.1 hypothetical protein [Streptococcaceae bacterium]